MPLTVLRRFDKVSPVLDKLSDVDGLWNTSRFDIPKLPGDPDNIADNLRAYIAGFSQEAQDTLERFDFCPSSQGGSVVHGAWQVRRD